MEFTSEKQHFLTPEQKDVKVKILQDLFAGVYKNIEDNHKLFDGEGIADLIINCLILFNRDILIDFIEQSNIREVSADGPSKFIDNLFAIIKSETLKGNHKEETTH